MKIKVRFTDRCLVIQVESKSYFSAQFYMTLFVIANVMSALWDEGVLDDDLNVKEGVGLDGINDVVVNVAMTSPYADMKQFGNDLKTIKNRLEPTAPGPDVRRFENDIRAAFENAVCIARCHTPEEAYEYGERMVKHIMELLTKEKK